MIIDGNVRFINELLFQLPSSRLSMRILSRNITKVVLRIETLLNDCLRRKN